MQKIADRKMQNFRASQATFFMRIICAGSGLPKLSNKKIVRESGIFFILLCAFFYPGSFYFAIYLEKFVRTLDR